MADQRIAVQLTEQVSVTQYVRRIIAVGLDGARIFALHTM